MKHKSNISGKLVGIGLALISVVTIIFAIMYGNLKKEYDRSRKESSGGNIIVSLNEIKQLSDNENANEKINILIDELQESRGNSNELEIKYIRIFYAVTIVSIVIVFGIIYLLMIRPFIKLEKYASEIARGNLDVGLKYERVNMFGEFTWAFDHMRREIKKARQCEREAIENNKTVIATLSHDIKTPIASIRAYSEALENNMDSSQERRNRYIEVITRKCDEVTKITNDMFLHSLHDLDKLVIKKEEVNIHSVIKATIEAMEGNKSDIRLLNLREAVLKNADEGRIEQVIENLINNARKYAPGIIEIDTDIKDNSYVLSIRDYGKGIMPEDMPFIFEKFYRGKNVGGEQGAGLGLFIVKYIMEQLDGEVKLENMSDGLKINLIFSMS